MSIHTYIGTHVFVFRICAGDVDKSPKFRIKNLRMHVRYYTVTPEIQKRVLTTLAQQPAVYPLLHTVMYGPEEIQVRTKQVLAGLRYTYTVIIIRLLF